MTNNQSDIIVVLGPTASGKTSFAAALAYNVNGEIISADSRQIYKRMDLGTGKDYEDYLVHGKQIKAHLIDIHEPGYKYNVYEFQKDFLNAYKHIRNKGKIPVLCGGTGMYIESVLKGYKLLPVPPDEQFRKELQEIDHEKLKQMLYSYNPQLHNTTDLTSKKRTIRAIEIAKHYKENPQEELEFPVIRPLIFGIKFERSLQRERITIRLKQRLEEGMIEEVKNLINEGIPVDDLIYYGLEYKFVSLYITGKLSYEAMFQQLNTAIHQFAKRQMTWFRKMEREGFQIHWLEGSLPLESKLEKAHQLLGIEK